MSHLILLSRFRDYSHASKFLYCKKPISHQKIKLIVEEGFMESNEYSEEPYEGGH
jgi:hypothetical protein